MPLSVSWPKWRAPPAMSAGSIGGETGRDRALLDDHAVLELRRAAQIDEAGDAGADRIGVGLRRIAHADAVDRHVVVVGEGEHVAVAGEAAADADPRSDRPCSRERSRISVEPSAPAARITTSAVIDCSAAANFSRSCPSGSRNTRQRPRSGRTCETRISVKISAPWL